MTAAGVGLLLEDEPPRLAYWLACVGIGIYLGGTRAFLMGGDRVPVVLRPLVPIATFQLGRLHHLLSPHEYLWLLTGWVVACGALTTRTSEPDEEQLERYLGAHRPGDRRAERAS